MIKNITITIGNKDIELTLKQAEELKKDLDTLLEPKKEFIPINTWPDRPYWFDRMPDTKPLRPHYLDTGHPPQIEKTVITCMSSSGGLQ